MAKKEYKVYRTIREMGSDPNVIPYFGVNQNWENEGELLIVQIPARLAIPDIQAGLSRWEKVLIELSIMGTIEEFQQLSSFEVIKSIEENKPFIVNSCMLTRKGIVGVLPFNCYVFLDSNEDQTEMIEALYD